MIRGQFLTFLVLFSQSIFCAANILGDECTKIAGKALKVRVVPPSEAKKVFRMKKAQPIKAQDEVAPFDQLRLSLMRPKKKAYVPQIYESLPEEFELFVNGPWAMKTNYVAGQRDFVLQKLNLPNNGQGRVVDVQTKVGFTKHNEVRRSKKRKSKKGRRSQGSYSGHISSQFVEQNGRWIMVHQGAFLRRSFPMWGHIPKFIDNPRRFFPLVSGEGIPTHLFVRLSQMKSLDIKPGKLSKIVVESVENLETSLYLMKDVQVRRFLENRPGHPLPDAILSPLFWQTPSGRQLATFVTQSGHKIKSLKISGGSNVKLKTLIDAGDVTPEEAMDRVKGLNIMGDVSETLENIRKVDPEFTGDVFVPSEFRVEVELEPLVTESTL